MNSILPRRGERVLVCGQTGSGKTVAMATLAAALSSEGRVAVVDCKVEQRYRRLPRARVVPTLQQLWAPETRQEKREGPSIAIWRPSPDLAQDPVLLDDAIRSVYQNYRGAVIIDELYPLHVGGRAGPGLVSLLTRGRSKGLTTIMGSQRPAWVSRFCLSEAQHYWVYSLVDRQDRRRLSEVVPDFPVDERVPKHHFLYYSNVSDMSGPMLFTPLPLRGEPRTHEPEPDERQDLHWI